MQNVWPLINLVREAKLSFTFSERDKDLDVEEEFDFNYLFIFIFLLPFLCVSVQKDSVSQVLLTILPH